MRRLRLIMFGVVLGVVCVNAQTLVIKICDIRNLKGQLCVAVFDSDEGFQSEKAFWYKYYLKSEHVANGEMNLRIQVPPGVYGVSVLDDENMDAQMKFNFLGIPLEGFGFGNYVHKAFRKPRFSDFSFEVEKNSTINLQISIRTMNILAD